MPSPRARRGAGGRPGATIRSGAATRGPPPGPLWPGDAGFTGPPAGGPGVRFLPCSPRGVALLSHAPAQRRYSNGVAFLVHTFDTAGGGCSRLPPAARAGWGDKHSPPPSGMWWYQSLFRLPHTMSHAQPSPCLTMGSRPDPARGVQGRGLVAAPLRSEARGEREGHGIAGMPSPSRHGAPLARGHILITTDIHHDKPRAPPGGAATAGPPRLRSSPGGEGSAAGRGLARGCLGPITFWRARRHSPLPPPGLQVLLILFAKAFASFNHSTCALSVSGRMFCLAGDTPGASNCSPKPLYSGIPTARPGRPPRTGRRRGQFPSGVGLSRALPGAAATRGRAAGSVLPTASAETPTEAERTAGEGVRFGDPGSG